MLTTLALAASSKSIVSGASQASFARLQASRPLMGPATSSSPFDEHPCSSCRRAQCPWVQATGLEFVLRAQACGNNSDLIFRHVLDDHDLRFLLHVVLVVGLVTSVSRMIFFRPQAHCTVRRAWRSCQRAFPKAQHDTEDMSLKSCNGP